MRTHRETGKMCGITWVRKFSSPMHLPWWSSQIMTCTIYMALSRAKHAKKVVSALRSSATVICLRCSCDGLDAPCWGRNVELNRLQPMPGYCSGRAFPRSQLRHCQSLSETARMKILNLDGLQR